MSGNRLPLLLASASPRRQELLRQMGVPFTVRPSQADETLSGTETPREAVLTLSRRKALAAARLHPGRFVLGADTLVSLDGKAFGKPVTQEQAAETLRLLSGRTHQVFTGVTVVSPEGKTFSAVDRSDVTFCPVPEEEILAYVAGGEPMDKAGSYAIQGGAALWVTRLEGSPSSVIGLPLHLVRELLLRAGYPLTGC